MTHRNSLFLFLLILIFGSVSLQAESSSSAWGSYGKREAEGESFQIPFKIEVKGTFTDGQIVLEGTTRIEDAKLTRYFKNQEMEERSTRSYATEDEGESSSSDSGSFDMGESISLLDGGFKLLKLTPVAGTSNTTVEVYFGEDQQFPALEAIELRLNPFKKTSFEVVLSSLSKVDFRKVKAVVTLKTGVPDDKKDATFTAELNGYLVLGDSYYESDYTDEDTTESDQNLGSSASF